MRYQGPLRAVILDWAGTVVDHGSCAPVQAFVELFRRAGVPITPAQAREPMGTAKRDHIAAILAMPEVAKRWREAIGAVPNEADVDRLYSGFIPIQMEEIARHAGLIPGTVEAVAEFRERGLKVGTTTGYNGLMMDVLIPLAAEGGFNPDCVVASDEVAEGRPAPWMCFTNMTFLGVYPPSACVKIGDTVPDIEAGLNAGLWTIAVTATGNELGLTHEEAAALPPDELRERLDVISQHFTAAGAHYAVPTIADTPSVLDAIAQHLAAGEAP